MQLRIKSTLAILTILMAGSWQAMAQDDRVAEFDQVLTTTEGLVVYNGLVERQIQTQAQELEELRAAINEVPDLERQIPPLLVRMVDGLADFIALDLPFLAEERAERLAELQLGVERADVSDAEKFRRVLEAWEIENEYGRTPSSYVGQLEIEGNTREVDFLRVGRIALLYQTTDEAGLTGAWDPRINDWVPLGSQHRNSVRQALRMTKNQIAPELMLIPIWPPE
jgi:hypothetical protein